jgi:cadmium resistance protein CadD (predicted permease)
MSAGRGVVVQTKIMETLASSCGASPGISHLVSHHRITQALQRWGHWIVPAVYILIGLYIFQKAGALGGVL